jgi:hypothetical protein
VLPSQAASRAASQDAGGGDCSYLCAARAKTLPPEKRNLHSGGACRSATRAAVSGVAEEIAVRRCSGDAHPSTLRRAQGSGRAVKRVPTADAEERSAAHAALVEASARRRYGPELRQRLSRRWTDPQTPAANCGPARPS